MIIDALGSGGMGVVYSAYDPRLDRKVAVKVLKQGVGSDTERQRLLREAKSMARLTHPNVVAVYDAGDEGGEVYVAMEYVRGMSLRRWLEASRSWRDVLSVYIQAGHGLAAAHDVGLIHRDFKPDNVLITEAGVAKVADFGLARTGESPAHEDLPLAEADTIRQTVALLTQAGMLVGTPAYMSPEQYFGLAADARSDQFGFCVALYEALLGELPFEGRTLPELAANVTSGRRRPTPAGPDVPRRIVEVIERGLLPLREERWPSMREVLTILSQDADVAKTRRRLAGLAITLGLAAAAAAIGATLRVEAEACSSGKTMISSVWGPIHASALSEAFAASSVGYATDAAIRVVDHLDQYAADWAVAYRDACMSHRRGESSGERLDQRMTCIDGRRRDLDAVVQALREPDAKVVERAIPMVRRLEDPAQCLDMKATAEPEGFGDQGVDDLLARARADGESGRFDAGLAVLDEVETLHGEVPELMATIKALRGRLLLAAGRYAEAELALEDAFYEAVALGVARPTIESALDRVRLGVDTHAEPALVGRWLRVAEAHTRRGDDEVRADFHAVAGAFHRTLVGDYEASRADLEEALRLRRAALPSDDPAIIGDLRGLGVALFKIGRFAEAEARLTEARELAERVLGPRHPRVAELLGNLSLIAARGGRHDEAVDLATRALEIREGAAGPSHPDVADALSNLGELEVRRDRPLAAIAYLERAVAVGTEAFGADHPKLALYYGVLGVALYKNRRDEEALAVMERALSLSEASLGPDHPNTAIFRANLGELLNDGGQFTRARDLVGSSLGVLREAFGESRGDLGPIYRELARAHLGLGQVEEAIEAARRGYDLAAGYDQITADERAKTTWVLAQALDRRPASREEALTLASAARAELAARAPGEVALITEIDAWIAGAVRRRR